MLAPSSVNREIDTRNHSDKDRFSVKLSIVELVLVKYSALSYVEHLPRVLILEEMVQDEDT